MSCTNCPSKVEEDNKIKETVRDVYGKVAVENTCGKDSGNTNSCCGAPADQNLEYAACLGYSDEECKSVPVGADMGLGCGNPMAIASLKPGEFVLDLGSGGGFDCFLASKKVGPTGRVIGVDMTPTMLSKARLNAEKGGYKNVEFRLGEIENLPIGDDSVDVIISNCVINLSTNKPRVYEEMGRVLKLGGRVAICDMVATRPLCQSIKNNLALYGGCMAGAMSVDEVRQELMKAGFGDVKINVKEASKVFIQKWAPECKAEDYVASADIEAIKAIL